MRKMFFLSAILSLTLWSCGNNSTLVGTRWVFVEDGEPTHFFIFFGTETAATLTENGETAVRIYRYSHPNLYFYEGEPWGEILWGRRQGDRINVAWFDDLSEEDRNAMSSQGILANENVFFMRIE